MFVAVQNFALSVAAPRQWSAIREATEADDELRRAVSQNNIEAVLIYAGLDKYIDTFREHEVRSSITSHNKTTML